MASDTPQLTDDASTVLVIENSLTPAMLPFERASERFERRLDLFESRLVFRLGLIWAVGVGLVLAAIGVWVAVLLHELG